MVTTAGALIPWASNTVIADRFARATDCVAERRGAEPCIFRGMRQWPDLDQLFSDRSENMITSRGVNDWALAGGVLRPDGRPTFGSPSSEAFHTLREIVATDGCFSCCDNAGQNWAVIVTGGQSRSAAKWQGIAIGLYEVDPNRWTAFGYR